MINAIIPSEKSTVQTERLLQSFLLRNHVPEHVKGFIHERHDEEGSHLNMMNSVC